MGKGFNNYMCKKPFHPGSKDNIKRAWMAEQRTENEKRKQDELKLQYDKEQDLYNNRSLVSKESKEKLALNFMYEAPPGAKREHQKEDDEPEFKFEWQRKYNAPREDFAKDNKEIRDQPFGISVRNVRCIKCHQWGHINTDRECPQFNQAGTSSGGVSMDPLELMKQMRDDGLQLKQSVLGHRFNAKQTNQMMLGSDDDQDGDPEVEFLKSLTSKQKKKLLLKLNKMAKKQDPKSDKKKKSKAKKKSKKKRKHRSKKASSSSDSSDSDTAKKEKSHKKKKHSSKRKHRTSRKDSSGDSSRSSSSSDESSSSTSSSSSGSDNEKRKRKHSEERTVAPPSDVPSSKKAKRSHKKKDSKKDKHSREDSAKRSQSSDSENSSAGEKHHKKKKKRKSKEKKHKSKSSSKEKTDPKTGSLFGDSGKDLLPPGHDDTEDTGKFPKTNMKPKTIIDFDFEKCIAKDDPRFEDERRSVLASHDTSDDGSKTSFTRSTAKPKKIIDFDFDAVSSNVGPLFTDPTKDLLQGENAENNSVKSPPQKKNGKPPKIIDFDFGALEQQGLCSSSKSSGSKPEKIIDFDIDLEKLEAAHGMGSRDKYSPSSPTTKRASESSPDKEMQGERKHKFQDQGSFLRNPSPPSKGARSISPPSFSP